MHVNSKKDRQIKCLSLVEVVTKGKTKSNEKREKGSKNLKDVTLANKSKDESFE